MYNKQNMFYT